MVRHKDSAAAVRWEVTHPKASLEATLAPALKRAFPLPDADDLFQRLLDALAQKERARG